MLNLLLAVAYGIDAVCFKFGTLALFVNKDPRSLATAAVGYQVCHWLSVCGFRLAVTKLVKNEHTAKGTCTKTMGTLVGTKVPL